MMYLSQAPTQAEVFAPEGPQPDVVRWDSTGKANPRAPDARNRGCPVGYFAQLVAPGTEGAVFYGDPNQWVRCRRLETSTPATIREESGLSARETLAIFTGALRQTLAEAPGRFKAWAGWGTAALVGVAALIGGAYILPLLPRGRAR